MADARLSQRIQALLAGTSSEAFREDVDSLLFLGRWHDAIPRALILDPILEAVDVRVYLLIRTFLAAQGLTRFPQYDEIQRLLNLARPTVARCILILRASRWISLCNCLRDGSGRFKGNVYAVHDEVLPLVDAIQLDGHYLAFLESIEAHHHRRVALVAHAVLETVRRQMRRGNPGNPGNAGPSSLMRLVEHPNGASAAHPKQIQRINREMGPMDPVQNLNSADSGKNLNLDADSPVQKLNWDPDTGVQNLNSEVKSLKTRPVSPTGKILNSAKTCCCSYLYKNKTTTNNNSTETSENSAPARQCLDAELIFPSDLNRDECHLAWEALQAHPAETRQDLLDELAAQIQAKRHTDKPIRNALGYLHWLCERLSEGHRPLTACGLKFRQLREREARQQARDQQQKQALSQLAPVTSDNPLVRQLQVIQALQAAKRGERHG